MQIRFFRNSVSFSYFFGDMDLSNAPPLTVNSLILLSLLRCMACASGYVPEGSKCIACPGGTSIGVAFAVIASSVAVPLTLMVILALVNNKPKKLSTGTKILKKLPRCMGLIKIMLTYLQILMTMTTTMPNIGWPSKFLDLSNFMSFVNLNFLSWFKLGSCNLAVPFHEEFIIQLSIPFVIFFSVVFAYYLTLLLKKPSSQHEKMHRLAFSIKIGLFCMLLAYPGITNTLSKMFICSAIPGLEESGEKWLEADWRTQCWKGDHLTFVGIAVFSIFLFSIGFPLVVFVSLWRNKEHLHDEKSESHEEIAFTLGGLYAQYDQQVSLKNVFELLFLKLYSLYQRLMISD